MTKCAGERMAWKLALVMTIVATVWMGAAASDEFVCLPGDEPCIDGFDEMSGDGGIITFTALPGKAVRIVMEDAVVYAGKIVYHEDDERAELTGDVRVERGDTTITSGSALLEINNEVYRFEDNVHVIERKEKLREVWADTLDYDGETSNMTAQGNVRMEEEGRWFRAQRMEYDAENEKARLSGDVTVVDEKNEMQAHELDIDLNSGNFTGRGPGRVVLTDLKKNKDDDK